MKRFGIITVVYLSLLMLVLPLEGAEKSSAIDPSSSPKSRTVNELYPGLTTRAMSWAIASTLPEGVVLRAGELVIENKELIEEGSSQASNRAIPAPAETTGTHQ